MDINANSALILVDVQKGFDQPFFGKRNNPEAEANIARLAGAWTRAGRPIVRVRHQSTDPRSPLGGPGDGFKDAVSDVTPALEIVKSVHSAFYGTPDLNAWLREAGIDQVVIAGIQTNRCCETTARMAADLGYDVLFALDATYTFGKDDLSADELSRATATNIDGQFGRVVTTADLTG
jgi:nicotinamidase-related amidase